MEPQMPAVIFKSVDFVCILSEYLYCIYGFVGQKKKNDNFLQFYKQKPVNMLINNLYIISNAYLKLQCVISARLESPNRIITVFEQVSQTLVQYECILAVQSLSVRTAV